MRKILLIAASCLLVLACGKTETTQKDQFILVRQPGGPDLGYSPESGVTLIKDGRHLFKDLDRNGVLDPYEDWRLDYAARARDLAGRLSKEQIAGLMLYSEHQAVPTDPEGYWSSLYNGMSLEKSGLPHSAINDKQKAFLKNDNLRAVLVVRVESPRISAEWNNNLQAFCEGIDFGIPVNISSDPRNEAEAKAEFNAGSGGQISLWPCQLGLAATFDPALVEEFGRIASKEYRALGIATALSPQADLGTEPRWFRTYGTFGESPELAADMVRAYVDGFQTTGKKGWGSESVNAMVKHWPGGGSGEGGRDAHYSFGKYSVYPGNGFQTLMRPFLEGAFKLRRGTEAASAVMPYYTVSYGQDPSGNNVGNGYSAYIVDSLLRHKYGYDGVVCTDWAVTHNHEKVEWALGKCWGYETASEAERHYAILKAGVDQFGGNNAMGPVLDAYKLWADEFGEESARSRFEESAVRLLLNMFRTGLFENPYVDPDVTEEVVGCPEFMKKGYDAQVKSVVMLKNHAGALPVAARSKVFVPKTHIAPSKGFFGPMTDDDKWEYRVDTAVVAKFYDVVEDPAQADFALVYMNEPYGPQGYEVEDREAGGNGYIPISLQYGDYTATDAREVSIAGGDPLESFTNRSYKGKTVSVYDKDDLEALRSARELMGDKPVVAAITAMRPMVLSEVDPLADAILVGFSIQDQAYLEIVSGAAEPSGLLPVQMPASMKEVELQCEDLPWDMEPYTDADGNKYDFAFGLDWKGVIADSRTRKYAR